MKISKKAQATEEAVLENYLIQSPSKLPIELEGKLQQHLQTRERLYRDLLRLPPQVFRNAKVLDLGCGTGEQDISYALWGAQLTLVDMNAESLRQLEDYFSRLGLRDSIDALEHQSLFDFCAQQDFEIAISEGVLHHTDAPSKGFANLVSRLAPGGFVVLQLAFDSSHFQRSLHRLILDILAGNDTDKLVAYSKRLFKETLERASRFGGRSIDQVVYDFYTNPKHRGISPTEIFDWFSKHGIRYYSSYPSIDPEGLVGGIHREDIFGRLLEQHPFSMALSSFIFLSAAEEDVDYLDFFKEEGQECVQAFDDMMAKSQLRDYEYGHSPDLHGLDEGMRIWLDSSQRLLAKRTGYWSGKMSLLKVEFSRLMEALRSKDVDAVETAIDSFTLLFRGYNGVPSNYIVGYKLPSA